MSPKAPFIHKLLNRIDRLDREAIRNYVVELARDVEDYREVLNLVPVGVVFLAPDGRVSYINEPALQLLGLARDQINPKKKFSEYVSDEALKNVFDRSLAQERLPEDIRIYHPREMDLRCMIFPLRVSGEERSAAILLNITAEKAAELERMRVARNDSLLRLAAGVAHEIGNPLNSISIHLSLLQKTLDKLPEASSTPVLKTIAIIQNETRRLDQIVRNFLKATRRPPLRFKLEDLNQIAGEAAHFFGPELEQRNITMRLRTDPGLPGFLMDRQRLYEVFINLIKNAAEAMPEGGNIDVILSHKNKVCIIEVLDQGAGIHEKDLAHIFEAYYTTKQEGSGLGLMLVYDAVSEHGGRIDVETKLGQGTKFTILLPIRQPKRQLPAK